MAMEFSTYGANAVLDGIAIPATLHLKAHLGNPGSSGTANPAVETSRKSFTRSAASGGANSNVAALTWGSAAATENWTHVSVWDAASGGNCWMVGTTIATVVVNIGDAVQVQSADLDLSLPIWT